MDLYIPHNLNNFNTYPTLLIFILTFTYFLHAWKNKASNKNNPPQPSGRWPVIGHLHLIGKYPHMSLGVLADKYGPIFMVRLGVHRALVVSSPEMAKECLGTNDKAFANRPESVVVEHLGYNYAMFGFSPYGPYWRQIRKITALELLSNHRLHMLRDVKTSEVRSAIKMIFDEHKAKAKMRTGASFESTTVDMKKWLSDITLNTSVKLVAGKSLREHYSSEEYNRIKNAFRKFFELAGTFVPADALPFLRWLDIGGHEKAIEKASKEIDRIAQGWLDEHKSGNINEHEKENKDFMNVMIEILNKGLDNPSKFDGDSITKATCMAMILGGTDTTAVTLIWALSLLLNNRDALTKAQQELDTQVGKQRQVDESDLKNLEYLQAILKETMRLYPAAPLSVARVSITDCTVKGYHIPAGTRLFVNLYKIHRDPNVWPDPLGFHPERFVTTHKEYDVRGQNYELIPFGNGRRICPGISFALQTMQFTLARLLHGFEMSTPGSEKVDMSEGVGLTNLKASPLEIVLVPRLADHLYDDHLV